MTNQLVSALFDVTTPLGTYTKLQWVNAHAAALEVAIAGGGVTQLVSVYTSGGQPVSVSTTRNAGEDDAAFCTRHGRRILDRMATDPPDA